jgi:hypothetical protein
MYTIQLMCVAFGLCSMMCDAKFGIQENLVLSNDPQFVIVDFLSLNQGASLL